MRLEASYFSDKLHLSMRNYVKNCITKGMVKAMPEELIHPPLNPQLCYCNGDPERMECWENDFHTLANYAFFIHENINNNITFPNFPYFTDIPFLYESSKPHEGLEERELQSRKDLLENDLFFNPSSYQTYIIYGFLNAYTFSKLSESVYLKGQKTTSVHKESSDFDSSLNCFATSLYFMLSKKVTQGDDTTRQNFKQTYGIELASKEWIEREVHLKRWPDTNIHELASEVFEILLRTMHLSYVTSFKKKAEDMQANIAENKLRCLSVITALCHIITKLCSSIDAYNQNNSDIIIKVLGLYLRTLHNERWVKFVINEDKQPEPSKLEPSNEESKDEVMIDTSKETQAHIRSPFQSLNTIYKSLWELFEDINKKSEQVPEVSTKISPIIYLILVKNLKKLEDNLTVDNDQFQFLVNKASSIFQSINDTEAVNIDRYAMQILCDVIEAKQEYACEALAKLKDNIPIETSPKADEEADPGYSMIRALFYIPEDYDPKKAKADQKEEIKYKAIEEIRSNLEMLEYITKKNLAAHKTFIMGKFYQIIGKVILKTKVKSYMKFFKEKLLTPYSKVILNIEQSPASCDVDPLYKSTYGSAVWSINERYNITQTYLELCEEMGEYNHLRKISQKFKNKLKADTKENQNDTTGKRGGTAADKQKATASNKVIDRKIHKRVCVSMLKALLTCVNEAYTSHITPKDTNNAKAQKSPLLTLSHKDELPELLKETFEIYNKFMRKDFKKTTTQAEKEILYECIFKMRVVYDGIKHHRYLDLTDNSLKAEGAEECNEWFKKLKQEHEGAKKEQVKQTSNK